MTENGLHLITPEQLRAPLVERTKLLSHVHRFTQATSGIQSEADDLVKWVDSRTPDKHDTALVIGRFQPLHFGHIYNWRIAGALAENVVIGIGSVGARDERNPFSVKEREAMVRLAIEEHGLTEKVRGIVHLEDYADDTKWFKEADKTIRGLLGKKPIDVVVGNNDWVNDIYRKEKIWTESPPLLQRGLYEGREIRKKVVARGFVL